MLNDQLSFSLLCFTAPTGSPVNVTVKAINSSSISVGWSKPGKNVLHGNLIRYEIEYRRVVCNEADPVNVTDNSWKSINVTNTSLSEEIGNLVFWSCYEVRMRAVTVGDGPYSNVTGVRTMEHGELLLSRFYSIFSAFISTCAKRPPACLVNFFIAFQTPDHIGTPQFISFKEV